MYPRCLLHGVDLVEISRIGTLYHKHGQRFLDRIYTTNEKSYILSSPSKTVERMAARFATKEALAKALGTGIAQSVSWQDIEVIKGQRGAVCVALTNGALKHAQRHGVDNWVISISHTGQNALASVIGYCSSLYRETYVEEKAILDSIG